MASIKSYTAKQYENARKAKFRAKKPKKPKAGASLKQMEGYISRYNNWVDKLKAADKKYRQKEADKKKREKLKSKISGL